MCEFKRGASDRFNEGKGQPDFQDGGTRGWFCEIFSRNIAIIIDNLEGLPYDGGRLG